MTKTVNYWPLHGGLAEVSDETGRFLVHPEELESVLREFEDVPCVSVCTNGECGGWYVRRACQPPYTYTYQQTLFPNL